MPRTLTIGHSPDADDAFMFYALTHNKIDTRGYEFRHHIQDIESLNRLAQRGELEITAVSLHAYAHLSRQYALLACGASVGSGYGPILVTREPHTLEELAGRIIAVPGTHHGLPDAAAGAPAMSAPRGAVRPDPGCRRRRKG